MELTAALVLAMNHFAATMAHVLKMKNLLLVTSVNVMLGGAETIAGLVHVIHHFAVTMATVEKTKIKT